MNIYGYFKIYKLRWDFKSKHWSLPSSDFFWITSTPGRDLFSESALDAIQDGGNFTRTTRFPPFKGSAGQTYTENRSLNVIAMKLKPGPSSTTNAIY